jgi:rhodanese-related sulfurtransferase
MRSISAEGLQKEIESGRGVRVLDVRTPGEFAAAHVRKAVLEPLETFKPAEVARVLANSPGEVYVMCQSGARAQKAIRQLGAVGMTKCVLVEGGISKWLEAGLPIERTGAGVISLERQVRIAAGARSVGNLTGRAGASWFPVAAGRRGRRSDVRGHLRQMRDGVGAGTDALESSRDTLIR